MRGVHLLAELGVWRMMASHHSAHEVVEFGLLAVVEHPAGGSERAVRACEGPAQTLRGHGVGGVGRLKVGSSMAMEVKGSGAQKALALWI